MPKLKQSVREQKNLEYRAAVAKHLTIAALHKDELAKLMCLSRSS